MGSIKKQGQSNRVMLFCLQSMPRCYKQDKSRTQCPWYNCANMFLGDINTGTWPSRSRESQMRQ
jgi:hypothetical protein